MSDKITNIPIKFKACKKLVPIKRPCDYGLELAFMQLETQLGTIEAYNRLVSFTNNLAKKINQGEIKKQNPVYGKNINGANLDDK